MKFQRCWALWPTREGIWERQGVLEGLSLSPPRTNSVSQSHLQLEQEIKQPKRVAEPPILTSVGKCLWAGQSHLLLNRLSDLPWACFPVCAIQMSLPRTVTHTYHCPEQKHPLQQPDRPVEALSPRSVKVPFECSLCRPPAGSHWASNSITLSLFPHQ